MSNRKQIIARLLLGVVGLGVIAGIPLLSPQGTGGVPVAHAECNGPHPPPSVDCEGDPTPTPTPKP